jgi:hypothetical protein
MVVKKKEIDHDRLMAVCRSNPKKEDTVNKFVSFLEDGGCLKKSRKFHAMYITLRQSDIIFFLSTGMFGNLVSADAT